MDSGKAPLAAQGAPGAQGASHVPTSTELALQRTDLADDRTRLAVTRTIAALDRTLMAWIRTATSLISFGFTIYKFFQALREGQASSQVHHLMGPRGVGLVMIGLGVGALVWALIDYKAQLNDLHADYKQYGPFRRSTAAAVATVISGLGILGFVLVFLRQ